MAVQDQDAVPQPPAVPDPPEQPDLPLPPPLPWLIYPGTEPPTVYWLDTRAYDNIQGLPADVLAARFCGSGDGGWMFLAFQAPHAPGYALYNLDSRQRVPLPATFMYPLDNTEYPLVVHAAAFSRPSTTGAVPLVVGAIASVEGRPTAAFWWGALDTWVTMAGEALAELPQDLIYIQDPRAFCFLMPNEELVMYGPADDPDGGGAVVLRRWDVDIGRRVSLLADVDSMKPDRGVIRRYLLEEDDGRLLMVLRFVYNGWPATTSFRILELIPYTTEEGEGNMTWMDAYELDDMILCVGPGCSRIFEVVDPDDEDGHLDDTTIYFLDERFFPLAAEPGGDDPANNVDDDMGATGDDVTDTAAVDDDMGAAEDGVPNTDAAVDDSMEEAEDDAPDPDDAAAVDDDMESVEDDDPDTGRYSMNERRVVDWPLDAPDSDVPPTWWLHYA